MRSVEEFWEETFRNLAKKGEYESRSIFDSDRPVVSSFLSLLPERAHILDFGSGAGRNALYLARSGHQVSVSDLSHEAMVICEARARAEGLQVQKCLYTSGKIQAEDATFDGILAWSVLDHMTLPEMNEVVREFARVAKEGAVLLCSFDPEEDPGYFECPYETMDDGTFRYTDGKWNGMLFRICRNREIRDSLKGGWITLDFRGSDPTQSRIVLCKRK